MARLEELRKSYKDVAGFAYVYIKEAHPDDEWQVDDNVEEHVVYQQPTSTAERMGLARTFIEELEVEGTTLVDDIRNTANACYAGWPERIYIVDTDGTILYKGGMGPYYFDPDDIEEFLRQRAAAETPAAE